MSRRWIFCPSAPTRRAAEAAPPEHLEHMPGDRRALAVRVGGENELVGALDRLGDVAHALLRLAVDLPEHAEIGVGVDRAVLGRQVADMAKGRQHLVAAAEILIDRLGFGRRLDDDYVHDRPLFFRSYRAAPGRNRRALRSREWVS